MTTTASALELGHHFADELPALSVEWNPTPVPEPELVVVNDDLAAEVGLAPAWLRSSDGLAVLAGNEVVPGSRPVAMGYAGHQFGNFNPRLGDGRALLLGELTGPDGRSWDLHLKGSGRTPFARGGDGRATLGPMLREYVISEAMHALRIPTTRSLAVVTTGEQVARQRVEPGAVLTRVAASHLRIGTLEFARSLDGGTSLQPLVDHAISRHHPDAADAARPALALLEHTARALARLVADWMLVGFIHGVMNTDNMALSGEGIDYGPCAFMDRFDSATVYSSIDHGGRYAYGNQPAIAQWNLARMAEAVLPLLDDERDTAIARATEVVESFVVHYQDAWAAGMVAKLGVPVDRPGHADLFDGLVALMRDARADHTTTFRALAESLRGDSERLRAVFDGHADSLDDWLDRWHDALGEADGPATADAMDAVNPLYIPRNHLVESALDAAMLDGDLRPFERLLARVTAPFEEVAGAERYAEPAPEDFERGHQTFCGT